MGGGAKLEGESNAKDLASDEEVKDSFDNNMSKDSSTYVSTDRTYKAAISVNRNNSNTEDILIENNIDVTEVRTNTSVSTDVRTDDASRYEDDIKKVINNANNDLRKNKILNAVKKILPKKKEILNYTLNNYFGVGVDGAVTLEFHTLRGKIPSLFFARWVNKIWYAIIGIRTLLSGWSRDLSQCCQLACDGKIIHIPLGTQGIIFLNINSYAGGAKMWAENSPKSSKNGENVDNIIFDSSKVEINDGLLEIVAVTGVNHLGAIKAGLSSATPLGQGKIITLTTTSSLPIQLDGEPWRQKPSKIRIKLADKVDIMLPTADK